ncbi:hypothetical protein HanXRQr2_Chr17g0795381 [Helianthus annuus]|uniref:Uncharacterized protein n=1 Tax=Helianthus annuus TaxID=4232 RepID=A0A9K3DGY0_HELAN|nr:hypothetical protein HanXRQr2_Chr17g0795381 [Helianthus annuus]KAJ0432775.1 hypothetical protein HanIR_Chr17g0862911 [Helianthus annuus]KAJ0812554.1 hypothetical protein HanPSC8_Chr17g0763271 [Helianthus annuus]
MVHHTYVAARSYGAFKRSQAWKTIQRIENEAGTHKTQAPQPSST